MTQEEKSLLLQDLCARLPYHIRLKVWLKDGTTEEGVLDLEHNYGDVLRDAFYYNEIIDIKPYLRPMSSMTEKEEKEFDKVFDIELKALEAPEGHTLESAASSAFVVDFYNKYHFDYRGLIEKGLAIATTKENNPYK